MAAYLINRSVCSSHEKTPDEMFFGKKVDLSNLKIFSSAVMVHVPKEKRRKWAEKSTRLIFIGYGNETKGSRKLTVSRDVIFHEVISEKQIEIDGNDDVEPKMGDTQALVTEGPAATVGPAKNGGPEAGNAEPTMMDAQTLSYGETEVIEISDDSIEGDATLEDGGDPEYIPDETRQRREGTNRHGAPKC